MAIWAAALVWSTLVCFFWGYHRPVEDIGLILGMPDWVFWGVVFPWAVCLVFSWWFCFVYMADDDLGRDPGESSGHA